VAILFINDHDGIFGLDAPLTKVQGKRHEYLGMTLDCVTTDKVHITMFDYIDSILDSLPPEMDS
jgi:hypothetical protein